MTIEKGKLVRWIDDKGFGFIKPFNSDIEIFIHITALKHMSRKPIIGDIIQYERSLDQNGKTRAVNAKIEGVKEALSLAPMVKPKITSHSNYIKEKPYKKHVFKIYEDKKRRIPFSTIVVILLIILAYQNVRREPINREQVNTPMLEVPTVEKNTQFQCQGKIWCSQMSSYSEAKFYLENCPGTKMDGDGDGEPCENQFK